MNDMNIFTKTKQDEERFTAFEEKLNKVIDTIEPYKDYTKFNELIKIQDEFKLKINDFFRNDRKLNIGVIGQVKAGKSTFLNTLLFNGQNVLPSAATPKTATLTKIEYSETNSVVVEYYTADEWQVLENNCKSEDKDDKSEAAREIIKMATENGLNSQDYIVRGSDEIFFDSSDELMRKLNDYVGENGKLTAFVKNVTVKMNKEELKSISVVDTPGLNDAIVSRTDKTREFIKLCDVVFFLSRASQFLDGNDTVLLSSQLPQDGVNNMIVICSRFDDGLVDVILDFDSIDEAIKSTMTQLKSRAKGVFGGSIKERMNTEMLSACLNPIFVSSICDNMSSKLQENFDEQEVLVFNNLNELNDVDGNVLRKIGNFDSVRAEFEKVVDSKDETLSKKAREFVPNGENSLKLTLTNLKSAAEKTLEILRTGDRDTLEKAKKETSLQINDVKGNIESIFGEMLANMELAKVSTMQKIRDASNECSRLKEKEGVDVHVTSHRVSDSVWYKPSTWGTSHKEYSSYETRYTYVDTNDAIESIRLFSTEACTEIEKVFSRTVDIVGTKQKLLQVVVDNFDASSEFYDPGFFRMITANALSMVEFPVLKIDVSQEQQSVTSRFTGRVRESSEMSQLQVLLADIIAGLFSTMADKLNTETTSFRKEINMLKNEFTQKLLESIEESFNEILEKLENKDREIQNYEHLLTLIKEAQAL